MSAFEAGSNTQCNQHNNIDPNNQNRERNESMLGDRDFWPAMSERVAGMRARHALVLRPLPAVLAALFSRACTSARNHCKTHGEFLLFDELLQGGSLSVLQS